MFISCDVSYDISHFMIWYRPLRARHAKASWLHPVAALARAWDRTITTHGEGRAYCGAVWHHLHQEVAPQVRDLTKKVCCIQILLSINKTYIPGIPGYTIYTMGYLRNSESPYFCTSLNVGPVLQAARWQPQKRREFPRSNHDASRGRRWAVLGRRRQALEDEVCCPFFGVYPIKP